VPFCPSRKRACLSKAREKKAIQSEDNSPKMKPARALSIKKAKRKHYQLKAMLLIGAINRSTNQEAAP
jgi:hypothetical protein